MVVTPLLLALALAAGEQAIERQHVLSITAPDIDGGILSEITWDNGALLLQGVVANPDGSLSGRYVVIPANTTTLTRLKEQTDSSVAYWQKKSRRVSPTGLGQISTGVDSKMPMYGVASLERRMSEAADMGGMQHKTIVKLGKLVLHERATGVAPYDGEVWSWSPAELNRIAYVDGEGDLWVAAAHGPHRPDHSIHTEVEDLQAVLTESGAQQVFGASVSALIALEAARNQPAIRQIAAYEPALLMDRSTYTAWVGRFDQEMAQGKVAAAEITCMLGLDLAPPAFTAMPRQLLEALTEKSMDSEDKEATSDTVTP